MITLLVLGAAEATARQIADLGSARGLRVGTGWTSSRPDWVLVASTDRRREALARYALPAFRVIEHAGLAREGGVSPDVLTAGLARMVEVGAVAPALSPAGVAMTRRLLPWIARVLERTLGADVPDQDETLARKAERTAEKASRRDALLSERPPKARTPAEIRERAERKAARKAERRGEKPSVIDPPRGPRIA